jgi:Ala-tRNA(Pro) deacylase
VTGLDRLRRFLDEHDVAYELRVHPVAFTAQELAAAEHVPGAVVAKVVIAFVEDEMVMLVLSATRSVDLWAFGVLVGGRPFRIAHEEEFTPRFPDCDAGAMPPFGNLYDVPVYVDDGLIAHDRVVFHAGTHDRTIDLAVADFRRLVEPVVASFSASIEARGG